MLRLLTVTAGRFLRRIFMYYLILESLKRCSFEEMKKLRGKTPFAAVLTVDEWKERCLEFGIEMDMEMELEATNVTKAVTNLDSLTGTFSIPDRRDISGPRNHFSFAMDENGIVFVDDSNYVEKIVESLADTRKWRLPSLERFLYDFLEKVISKDLSFLESSEKRLNEIEETILAGKVNKYPGELNKIRGDLLDLRVHYEQLIDLGQELEENENNFFADENLRYFRLFTERVMRLKDIVSGQREYVMQLRDLIQTQLDFKQNKTVSLLTVITSIFMPLTLVTGWYGMNFRFMPELEWKYGYPAVIALTVVIVIVCIIWFKRKKWM